MHTVAQLKSGNLKNTTTLKLSEGLTDIPEEVFQLADTLEVLDLSGNKLQALPDRFSSLKKLRILFLSNNDFVVLPSVLYTLKNLDIVGFKANKIQHVPENSIPVSLRWLILTDNCIEELPHSIGACTKLQKVMLAGNQLKGLPNEMAACKTIELLRISSNKMDVFPDWLCTLPRLSWLAYSSNPFQIQPSVSNILSSIPWNELLVEELLGEGASGMIYKARWSSPVGSKDVAVKLFKGAITSDGLPKDEMLACMQAGQHDHLVNVLGVIEKHPAGTLGLVMSLIPKDYTNLGGPPSFVTCTRDTFSDGIQFSVHAILAIIKGIASVAQHLHERGIMHGDLYAHNTLINSDFSPLLGDFGAATLYDTSNKDLAFYLERMEVRAFGCLLDDLLRYVIVSNENEKKTEMLLISLCDRSMSPLFTERPDFKSIVFELENEGCLS